MLENLKNIKNLYNEGTNIIEHINARYSSESNLIESIAVSYDLQAGSYIQRESEEPGWKDHYFDEYSKVLNRLPPCDSLLEVGVGEATTLKNLLPRISHAPSTIFGFDISYSRIRYGINYLKKNNIPNSILFLGDLFHAAIRDNSIDLVYTSHSLEPNGGREKEALTELYRIAGKYLVLFEPGYELGDTKTKAFIEKHGYVKNLYSTAVELGYKVIEHKVLLDRDSVSGNQNNTAVLIIEKTNKPGNDSILSRGNYLACPITKAPLRLIRGNYFCRDSLLLYPVVDNIPCLLPANAIVATHYLDEL